MGAVALVVVSEASPTLSLEAQILRVALLSLGSTIWWHGGSDDRLRMRSRLDARSPRH